MAATRIAGAVEPLSVDWSKWWFPATLIGLHHKNDAVAARAKEALMSIYRELRAAGITTRKAATLTGLSRATATSRPCPPLRVVPEVPANRLSAAERANVVATLDSPRFVDQPPLQVYAQLLDEDTYLCSVSLMYRILGEHRQVKERRRLARHPARVRPELVATGPTRCTRGISSATRRC